MSNKPLSQLSYDSTNKITVCNYSNEFIDLDEKKGILSRAETPNSPDMLYINDEEKEIWFVEFKSSKFKNLNDLKGKISLKKKFFAGLFLIYEIYCDKSCEYKNYNKYYFIVYNKEQSITYEDELLDSFDANSNRCIEFGLEDLKPQFVKDIFTENCDNLKKLFDIRFNIQFT